MEFAPSKPIYQQIADQIANRITAGQYREGDRIPSVRDVAIELGVNPNTVMRTYDHLQSEGIIFNRRGVGYHVAEGARQRILDAARRHFLDEELPLLRQKMQMLGLTVADLNLD